MYILLDNNNKILDFCKEKVNGYIETDKEVVYTYDGKICFKEETETEEYKKAEKTFNEKQAIYCELTELQMWFNIFYQKEEQKLRRLSTLNIKTDEDEDAKTELMNLYNIAEVKRRRIQELETNLDNLIKGVKYAN